MYANEGKVRLLTVAHNSRGKDDRPDAQQNTTDRRTEGLPVIYKTESFDEIMAIW